MSYELIGSQGSIGQFATTSGLADLVKASRGSSVLKAFFDEGYTDNCHDVAQALRQIEGPADVTSTALGLAKMIEDLKVAAISNGESEEPVRKASGMDAILESMPDVEALSTFAKALDGGVGVNAYVRAYKALEESGCWYSRTMQCWVRKEAPAVGDVHVDKPIGAVKPKQQGEDDEKEKDDPGTPERSIGQGR